MCAVMGRYKAALLACRRSPLARFSLSQVAPADADAIRKTPYGPDTPRPEGMAVKSFVTFLLENAVKKMRERYRARAERTYGQGNVAPYAATSTGALQLDAIEKWIKMLGERCGAA